MPCLRRRQSDRERLPTSAARDAGLTREERYRALSASGNPEFSIILKVIRALRIKLHASPAATEKPKRTTRRKSTDELSAA
jgi:DNA-binding phage protein